MNRMRTSLLAAACILGLAAAERPAVAEPARPFARIINDIRAELPSDMVMRLPTQEALDGVQDPFYALVDSYEAGEVRISINSYPNCTARACMRGYFTATRPGFEPSFQDYIDEFEIGRAPITLTDGIVGNYITVEGVRAPFSVVFWEQDQQFYLVNVPTVDISEAGRQQTLDFAISMANEPPITSERSID